MAILLCAWGCGADPAERKVADLIGDREARFQAVRDRGDWVCGELNSPASQPSPPGYRRFVFDAKASIVSIDPKRQVAGRPATENPACAKRFAEQTVEQRMTCAAAPDLRVAQQEQLNFDNLWIRHCG
jgi:hypothetical protein